MQLRPELQITTLIKAMVDVIIPAVDPGNKLAVEQSQLVVGMLSLMQRQLPLQFRFDRDELSRLTATVLELQDIVGEDGSAELERARRLGTDVLGRCQGDPGDLRSAIAELRMVIGQIADTTGSVADEDRIRRIEACILNMSREQLLRDRALLLSQGWELDPDTLPMIEALPPPSLLGV